MTTEAIVPYITMWPKQHRQIVVNRPVELPATVPATIFLWQRTNACPSFASKMFKYDCAAVI